MIKNIHAWYGATTKYEPVRVVARKTGLVRTTLDRQLARDELPIEAIIEISRAYKVSPVVSLLELGIITGHEVKAAQRIAGAKALTDVELLTETKSRIETRIDNLDT